jgi:hypothetical protein
LRERLVDYFQGLPLLSDTGHAFRQFSEKPWETQDVPGLAEFLEACTQRSYPRGNIAALDL